VIKSLGWLAYHDFEGGAFDTGERPRIVGDLGDKRILILRNHGLMTVGKTVGEAFVWMYRIETACRIQIDALSGGSELQSLSEATQAKIIEQGLKMYGPAASSRPAKSGRPCCASSSASTARRTARDDAGRPHRVRGARLERPGHRGQRLRTSLRPSVY
jgi:Class II Aldolase and Adducin N-terminal domain